jgi:iron(III) transport system permease protein
VSTGAAQVEGFRAAPVRYPEYREPGGLARRLSGWSPLVLALIALLLLLIVPPFYFLLKTSLYTTNADGSFGDFTFDFYRELFSSPRLPSHFLNSALFAVGSGVLAIVLGGAQAWIVERTGTPLRQYVFLIAVVSLGIPHVLYTVAWLLILGKGGPVNLFLMGALGTDSPVFSVNSMWGMILIEGMIWAPLGFLLLSSVFRMADASFEEAAMMSGAGMFTVFRRITLKLATPALLALLLLVCIRAFEGFDIPALVGSAGGVSVLSTDIFESIRKDLPSNYGQAGAFSVVLMVVVVILLSLHRRLLRHAARYQTITGKGYRPRVIRLGRWRYLTATVLGIFFLALLVIPVAMIVLASALPFYDGVRFDVFSRLTLDNYRLVANSPSFREAIFNTIVMGAATATAVCLLTAGGAWLSVRRYKGGWLLDQLATLPLIFPSIVLGVAFLQLFVNAPIAVYGTLASLVVAALVQYLPYGMRFCHAGAMQIHRELEEAAEMSGAGKFATFVRIVLPLIAPAIATSWLFVMLMSVRAVAMPILLVGPRSQVVAVTLFDLWGNGQITSLAAVGVVWTALMMCIGVIFYGFARRFGLTIS